jgi:hypothetical protein
MKMEWSGKSEWKEEKKKRVTTKNSALETKQRNGK